MVEQGASTSSIPLHSPAEVAPRPMSPGDAAVYFLIGAVLDIIIGLPHLGDVLHGALLNPDSYMRLVRLREIVAQRKLVYVIARDGSGDGTLLAWSHLMDGVLLALSAPLRLFMGEWQAVQWVAVAFGPLCVGLLSLALVWAAWPITDRQWRWTAPLLAASSLFVAGYGLPGIVHHHVLIALTIVLSAGWAARAGPAGAKAGWHMGLWCGAGLWLTPETMPFTLIAFGAVGLAWLSRPSHPGYRAALRSAGTGFLLLIAVALAIDPPYGGYQDAELDRLSLVYLVLAIAVCAIGWTLWRLGRLPLSAARRRAIGFAVALAGLGLWLALFPGVIKGHYALMDAARMQAFFGVLSEMQPIGTLHDAWADLLDGVLATLAVAAIAIRRRSLLWAYGALVGIFTLVLGALHLRFATYPTIFAAAVVPIAGTYAGRSLAQRAAGIQSFARIALLALFFIGPRAGEAVGRLSSPATTQAATTAASCEPRSVVGMLAPYAGQIVMADINDNPELLYRTRIITAGSAYLPDISAFMRLRAAWRSLPSADVPDEVRSTRAGWLLFCPAAGRSRLVADLPPVTLWDRLNRNDVPAWLSKAGDAPGSGYTLYRIAR